MLIYKIFLPAEWAALEAQGQTKGAPVDLVDGFIHFSTAAQVAETAAKHFADAGDLVLCAVQSDGLDGLKWEPSRGGALFPHLYRELRIGDVLWMKALPFENGAHQFPEGVL